MSDSQVTPHSCEHCRTILINETGHHDKLKLCYSFSDVEKLAKRKTPCAFFQWALSIPTAGLGSTDKLRLSVSSGDENLACLFASWRSKDDQPRETNEEGRGCTLHIFASDDNCAGRYVKSRPLTESRADQNSLLRCQRQLNRCMLHHEECGEISRQFQSNTSPARLLHILEGSPIRLCEISQGQSHVYAALSYCWGKNEHQKNSQTTQANFKNRQQKVESDSLPQTIIDAIKVANSLKLSYIWVDALCIVQDDKEDRQKEIANMANIYRGATITIVAASAEESTEGFLGARRPVGTYGRLFRLPYRHKDENNEGYVLLSENPNFDTHQEPIDKRAWTMQEDILSQRLLRFGSKQTTWRCLKEWKTLDGGDYPRLENENPEYDISSPYQAQGVQSKMASDGELGVSMAAASWQQNITKYASRELTNAADRLSACAALSQTYSEIRGFQATDYLAGLWKNDIASGLLWYRSGEHSHAECKNRRIFGPSWSWASLNKPIKYIDRYESETSSVTHANVELVDSHITYESENHKYSAVKSGRLYLNGVLKRAYWDGCCLRQCDDGFETLPVNICWDSTPESLPRIVWCLEIIRSYLSLGLILDRDCNGVDFRRVGFFECRNKVELTKPWFNKAERQVVTII